MPDLSRPWMAAFENLVPAAEIALDRQNTLATAMVEPHVLEDVRPGDLWLRDFDRLDGRIPYFCSVTCRDTFRRLLAAQEPHRSTQSAKTDTFPLSA